MDGLLLARLSDKEKKRQEVIWELLQTERDYLRDLDLIVEVRVGVVAPPQTAAIVPAGLMCSVRRAPRWPDTVRERTHRAISTRSAPKS